MRIHPTRHAFAACLACCLASGCGESWQADTHPASGRISINGKPPAGALVQLVPAEGIKPDERNSRPWGLVKGDGTFILSTYDGKPGVPVGEYRLTITWPPDASRPSMMDRLKSRYARPEQSPRKVTIKPGDNVLPPIDLAGVDVDMKAGPAVPVGPMMITPRSPKAAGGRR